jgi:hypothetical protein
VDTSGERLLPVFATLASKYVQILGGGSRPYVQVMQQLLFFVFLFIYSQSSRFLVETALLCIPIPTVFLHFSHFQF